jgi:hypothetical protein
MFELAGMLLLLLLPSAAAASVGHSNAVGGV